MPHTTKTLYTGRFLSFGIESLTLPNGVALELEIVRHPGGAAIVCLDRQQRVCLLRQYRHATGGWLWELPAGKLEAGERPQQTAARELEEEAGLRARDWQALGSTWATPGFCDEVIHLFLARDLESTSPRHESHELIEIHWLPFEEALAQVHDGTTRDAKTMLGLMLAGNVLSNQAAS